MERQKRVAAIHDISCFGKCSLTVALPIISAAGVETSVIPTAILSTHTGGFTGFTYRDLTEDILPIVAHWQTLQLQFDAVYSGFLGSFEQINVMEQVFDKLKTPDNLIVVDPVMADNGALYSIFPQNYPDGMKRLCKKADVILPNLTEAALLLGEPYLEGPYTREYIESTVQKLSGLGPERVVLTGVYFDDFELGAAAYDKRTGKTSFALSTRIEGSYHGTGDVFASAIVAALVLGKTMEEAIRIAVDFTTDSIAWTKAAGTDIRFGVNFEQGLYGLSKRLVG